MNNLVVLLVVAPATLLSLIGTALVRFVAVRRGWFDDPNDVRKIHSGNIPRLGGVGIFWSFALTLGGAALVLRSGDFANASFAVPLLAALALCHFTGLYDDFRNMRARWKLALQIVAAVFLMAGGFHFRSLALPDTLVSLGLLSYPISLLWIVGVSNAVNMIDGMDGLAGGITAIAAFSFGVVYVAVGNTAAALASFALAGAILGFLMHNYPPATIFMGDSGSLFLGIALAALPMLHRGSATQVAGLLPGITLLLIPIFDVFVSMLRRAKRGASVMSPDKEHLHHKLMLLGLNQRTTLIVIYGVQLSISCLVLCGLIIPYRFYFGLLIMSWVLAALGFVWLHFATNPKNRDHAYHAIKRP
jgi:UDP-GlcNAc:undecaprenyl-phosphate GlcNAc-1-phosphate transferase